MTPWAQSLFALFLCLLPVGGTACAKLPTPPGAPDFEPNVGQAGKDVVWVPTSQALVNRCWTWRTSRHRTDWSTWVRATVVS